MSDPCLHNATCINYLPGYICKCQQGWDGINCENDIDECLSMTCANNGNCVNFNGSYNCNCTEFWEGVDCSVDINECLTNPCSSAYKCMNSYGGYGCLNCTTIDCKNGGSCIYSLSGPLCSCIPGWIGEFCEINFKCVCNDTWTGKTCETYNYCYNIPCLNNGISQNGADNFTCLCHQGYTGDICETTIDWCESDPCHHNGSCVNIVYGFYCHCMAGWVGRQCGHDIDECMWSTCPRGSFCDNTEGGYRCLWSSMKRQRDKRKQIVIQLKLQPISSLEGQLETVKASVTCLVHKFICPNDKPTTNPHIMEITGGINYSVAFRFTSKCGNREVSSEEFSRFAKTALTVANTIPCFIGLKYIDFEG